jgi:hypothetical protein
MVTKRRSAHWLGLLSGFLLTGAALSPAQAQPRAEGAARVRLAEAYGRLPLAFEENRGQTDGQVRFFSRGQGYGLFLTPTEAVLALCPGDGGHVLRLGLSGASPAVRIAGEEGLPGKANDLRGGDPARWRTGIPTYGKVRYQGIYAGIDLVFYGRERQLEHDFVLAPGADPRRIRLAITGADRVEIDPGGDLVFHMGGRQILLRKAVAYQDTGGHRVEIPSRYRLLPAETSGVPRVGFELAAYDHTRTLVIDPVLVYSTYLGGSGFDAGNSIAIDAAGNAYVTGETSSQSFPQALHFGPQKPPDAFVAKLDPSGSHLLYSTVFGGAYYDTGLSIAVDPHGEAYVTGQTFSSDFPYGTGRPAGAPPPPPVPILEYGRGFVAKLGASGSSIVFSWILFDSDEPTLGTDIAVDSQGHAFVIMTSGFAHHTFLAAFNPDGTDYYNSGPPLSTGCPGGSGPDFLTALAVDAADNLYLAGYTNLFEAFASKQTSSGALVYARCLAGSRADLAEAIAADAAGNAYVTGVTSSSDFPTVNPLQPAPNGGGDIFVTKLAPTGGIVYSTYLGGTAEEAGLGIGADGQGNAYVTGYTSSADFPLRRPLPVRCQPGAEGSCTFLTKINPTGSGIVYSTFIERTIHSGPNMYLVFLGGEPIAVDPAGNVYLTGTTFDPSFPAVNALQARYGGGGDAFVMKIADNQPPVCTAAFASPATIWPPNGKLTPVSIQGVTDPEGGAVKIAIDRITQDEPPSGGTPDATGLGTATAQLRAERTGGGDGRVYHITFTAADAQGATCTGTVDVCVPHDRGHGGTCGDGGALWSSTGG